MMTSKCAKTHMRVPSAVQPLLCQLTVPEPVRSPFTQGGYTAIGSLPRALQLGRQGSWTTAHLYRQSLLASPYLYERILKEEHGVVKILSWQDDFILP